MGPVAAVGSGSIMVPPKFPTDAAGGATQVARNGADGPAPNPHRRNHRPLFSGQVLGGHGRLLFAGGKPSVPLYRTAPSKSFRRDLRCTSI